MTTATARAPRVLPEPLPILECAYDGCEMGGWRTRRKFQVRDEARKQEYCCGQCRITAGNKRALAARKRQNERAKLNRKPVLQMANRPTHSPHCG